MTCTKTSCTFGDLFLLVRYVEEVTFSNGGYILCARGTFWVKMVYSWVRVGIWASLGIFDHVRGVPSGSPNPDSISDQNCPFSHPFSDLASKIHTHSRDRNYVIIT